MAAKFKVITLSTFSQLFELEADILAKAGGELTAFKPGGEQQLISVLRDADAILTGRTRVTAKIIDSLDKCKIIVRCGIGVDNIDVQAATRRNIIVSNVPDYCIDEVSDHALALLFSWARRIAQSDKLVKSGKWGVQQLPLLSRLRGQNLGILGFGRIGRAVAEKALPFGLRILVCDPYLPEQMIDQKRFRLVDFETLVREADYITIHVPLTPDTKGMFGEKEFDKMKPSAFLINAARGGIVDEQALANAVSAGRIAGAGLDALVKEPPESHSPLLKMDNVLITPHSAWYSEEAFIELHRKAAEEAARVLRGEPPLYSVTS